MADVIVDEEYMENQKENLVNSLTQMNGIIDLYIEQLNEILQYAIPSGSTAQVLGVYVEYAKQLKGNLQMIAEQISEIVTHYVCDIDAADTYCF